MKVRHWGKAAGFEGGGGRFETAARHRLYTMSWYLANEKKIIDQFASGQGLSDLRKAIEANGFPALQDFIDEGVTTNITLCIGQLNQLVKKTRDESVRVTAEGLAKLMRGQKVAVITQGFGYEDDEEEDETGESLDPPEPAKPTKPVARKAKKKAAAKKPAARKAKGKTAPKKDRAWFERKVAALKTELEKLPTDRQEQLKRELKDNRKRE